MTFQYPETLHQRRHGPRGYADYKNYKPWLRDEFEFRCIFCLCRETWFPDGDDSFSVDHLQPRSTAPEKAQQYGNLVYACWRCNSAKQDSNSPLNPNEDALAEHVQVLDDGNVRSFTLEGEALIRACRLDRPKLTEFRRGVIELRRLFQRRGDAATSLFRKYFGYPENLPCLATLRPPGGNTRREGINESHYELRRRGELPEFY